MFRLFPLYNPENPVHTRALEQLACVPAGTFGRTRTYLQDLEAAIKTGQKNGLTDVYLTHFGTPVIGFSGFLIAGFGLLSQAAQFKIKYHGFNPHEPGQLSNLNYVGDVVRAQGLSEQQMHLVDKLDGIAWAVTNPNPFPTDPLNRPHEKPSQHPTWPALS